MIHNHLMIMVSVKKRNPVMRDEDGIVDEEQQSSRWTGGAGPRMLSLVCGMRHALAKHSIDQH